MKTKNFFDMEIFCVKRFAVEFRPFCDFCRNFLQKLLQKLFAETFCRNFWPIFARFWPFFHFFCRNFLLFAETFCRNFLQKLLEPNSGRFRAFLGILQKLLGVLLRVPIRRLNGNRRVNTGPAAETGTLNQF